MHKSGVCHRDIKPDNIIYNPVTEKIKLIDFNIAKRGGIDASSIKMMTKTGTPVYKAPEMIENIVYDEKVDLWMAGCVLYQMLFGVPPFFDENVAKLNEMILSGNFKIPKDKVVDEIALDLVKKLLVIDPVERLSAQEALLHPYIIIV